MDLAEFLVPAGTDLAVKLLFRKKDYIRREGCKEGFYIRKVVLFIEGKFYPQFSRNAT